jgi:uncharacterized protein HemX
MNFKVPASRNHALPANRQVEGEGILRMVLLAITLAMPLASMIFLKVQQTRLSYEMSDVRARIHNEEEVRRTLLLERSRYQRDEEVQAYAQGAGLLPRKQSHLIQRSFTVEDQRLAKLQGAPPTGL